MNVFGEAAVIIMPKQKNKTKYEYFLTDLRVVLLVTSSRMLSSSHAHESVSSRAHEWMHGMHGIRKRPIIT